MLERESEISAILNFKPDRIGHLLFVKEYHLASVNKLLTKVLLSKLYKLINFESN